jgi:hypothetical protein
MSVHKNLTVPYHQQDTNYYCGAACAQMVLASAKVGAGLLDQDDLYADNHSHSTAESGWATAPDGLQWTMNDRRPAAFAATNWFALDALASEDAISRIIAWTIQHWEVAPIALVFGSQHWIVVRGYTCSADPTSSSDTTFSIMSFDVNNPWPPVPSWSNPSAGAPPPHGSADGCGGGGTRGIDNENVSYTQWQSTYMTGVTWGHWNAKFVAVCDPQPPAERVGIQWRPDRRFSGERLIKPKDGTESALAGLREYGLLERPQWKEALRGTKPADPMLVQQLHRRDSFYYIVPMQRSAKEVPALVSVDARFGDYLQAVSSLKPDANLLLQLDKKAVMSLVEHQRLELEDKLGRLKVRPEAICLYPILVWKPCLESLSPFWPFYMLGVGTHHIYIRVDGAVFTQLHDTSHGI